MRIKSTVLAVVFLLSISLAGAESSFYRSPIGLGISGGPVGGIGFAYRKHFENQFGLHGAMFGLGAKGSTYSWAWLNAGAQGMYTLHQTDERRFRLYVLAGVGVFADGDEGSYWEESPDDDFTWDITTTVGAGLGMEFLLGETVAISLDSPLSAFIHEDGDFEMYPIPGLSIVYYLK